MSAIRARPSSPALQRRPPLGRTRSLPAVSDNALRGPGTTTAGASHVLLARCQPRPTRRAALLAVLVHIPPQARQHAASAQPAKPITTRVLRRPALPVPPDVFLTAAAAILCVLASAALVRTLPRAAPPAAKIAHRGSTTTTVTQAARAGCVLRTRSPSALAQPPARRARKAELQSEARPAARLCKCPQFGSDAPRSGQRAQRQMAAVRSWRRCWPRAQGFQRWARHRWASCLRAQTETKRRMRSLSIKGVFGSLQAEISTMAQVSAQSRFVDFVILPRAFSSTSNMRGLLNAIMFRRCRSSAAVRDD